MDVYISILRHFQMSNFRRNLNGLGSANSNNLEGIWGEKFLQTLRTN